MDLPISIFDFKSYCDLSSALMNRLWNNWLTFIDYKIKLTDVALFFLRYNLA